MTSNLIGKTIKYQVGQNGTVQTGTILDVSVTGSLNISGVWYNQANIIIVEICNADNIDGQQLLFG